MSEAWLIVFQNAKSIFIPLFQMEVPAHMWSPTSLIVNGKETQYPLPEPYLPINFPNSTGMRYEAEEVRQCLLKGNVLVLRMN